MGGHEGKNSGWGNRDQDFGDPMPDPALSKKPDAASEDAANQSGNDRGKVAGAQGNQPPDQDIKPGTKLDLEEKL